MSAPRRLEGARALGVIAACLVGIVLAGVVERRSVQRANRMHRDGAFTTAARLYGARTDTDSASGRFHYNFGTTLLGLESNAAASELTRAVRSDDLALRAEAFYNLGLWNLERAQGRTAPDSALAYVVGAIAAGKEVLRLEPGRADARWNLALAQRMLDSINAGDSPAGSENVDGSNDADEQILSEDLREFEDVGEVEDAPREGADEALAQADSTELLSAQEAEAILNADPDRSVIVRKLLTYAGRVRPRPFGRPANPRW